MSVLINASTSTGLVQSADTSGEIELQSNGTTALKVNTNEGIQILNCLGVGNATPSTSGAGITFPATASASSDANTLDDYEEGTFTPDLKNSSSSSTFTNKWGQYVKVGQVVTCWGGFDNGNTGTAGSVVTLYSLPFTANSNGTTAFCAGTIAYNSGTASYVALRGSQGAVNFDLYTVSAQYTAQISYAVFFVTYRTT